MPAVRDAILTACALAFAYALLPQVLYGFRRKTGTVTVQTATITAVGLYATAGVYLSLTLWFATVTCFLTASLWAVLLLQRLLYGPPTPAALPRQPHARGQ